MVAAPMSFWFEKCWRGQVLSDAKIVDVPFLAVLGDAVQGVTSAVWLATQTRNNDAMRPPVPSENGILAVSDSQSARLTCCSHVFPVSYHTAFLVRDDHN